MPQTRGRSKTRKEESPREQSKTCKRGHERNNTPQEEKQFQTVNCERGRGHGREKNNSSFTKKKSHLLNEILEDSDYDKDPTESSPPVFILSASPNDTHTSAPTGSCRVGS